MKAVVAAAFCASTDTNNVPCSGRRAQILFQGVSLFLQHPCRALPCIQLCWCASFLQWASWLQGHLNTNHAHSIIDNALPFAGATRPCVGRARTSRRVPLAGLLCAVSPGPRPRLFRPVSRPVCGLGCGCLVRLRFASRSLAVWRVCAIAPSFISGWRAFSSVSLCTYIIDNRTMSVQSFGRLGAPALTLLGDLADRAVQAGRPGLCRAAFILGSLRELSVALCRGNASLCRLGAYVAARAAGRTPMCGLARPSAEVVSACLAPVCGFGVWGVWFGFALRCVALLCGVLVRLHLALFPAGGPFFPSLYVKV
jgi:hypothetical protein